jgi:tetratricopeptide (TPR) repeat protein
MKQRKITKMTCMLGIISLALGCFGCEWSSGPGHHNPIETSEPEIGITPDVKDTYEKIETIETYSEVVKHQEAEVVSEDAPRTLTDEQAFGHTDQQLIRMARIALSKKDKDLALEWARQASSLNPDRAEPYNIMGRVWLERSEWDKAILNLEKAVSIVPTNHYYRNNLGFAYLLKKDFIRAVEELEQATEQESVPTYMINNLGLAYEGAGRFQEAISEFKKAVGQSPKYINAKLNLERIQTVAKLSDIEKKTNDDSSIELDDEFEGEDEDEILIESDSF